MATTFKFKADGSGYARGLEQMRGQTKQFAGKVKGLLAGAFAFAGIGGIKTLIQDMADMGRAANRLGVSVKMFQKLSYAANQTGVDAERLADAMKDLDVKLTDGIMRGGSFAELIEELGMNMQDLADMSPDQRMLAFADAIQDASGSLSRFGADEFGDAMYELLPLLELGSEGILKLADGVYTLSDAQVAAAERATVKVDGVMANMKAFASVFLANAIQAFEYYVTMGTQAALEMGKAFSNLGDLLIAAVTFDGDAIKQSFNALVDDAEGALYRVKQAGKEILDEQLTQEGADEKAGATRAEIARRKAEIDAKKKQLDEIAKLEEKAAAEKRKREESELDAIERLKQASAERLAIEKEIAELDPFDDSNAVKIAQKELDLELATTKELKAQKALNKEREAAADKEAAAAQKIADAKKEAAEKDDDAREDAASTRAQIAQERRDREEIGMDEGQIIARRQQELRAAQAEQEALRKKAQADGTVTGLEDKGLAEGQLAIENLKTEIANLQSGADGAEPGPETAPNIIASSLAAIGGGGGAAMFTADPLLSENKKQTRALEGILGALGGTEDGGTINNPEL